MFIYFCPSYGNLQKHTVNEMSNRKHFPSSSIWIVWITFLRNSRISKTWHINRHVYWTEKLVSFRINYSKPQKERLKQDMLNVPAVFFHHGGAQPPESRCAFLWLRTSRMLTIIKIIHWFLHGYAFANSSNTGKMDKNRLKIMARRGIGRLITCTNFI